MHSWLDTKTFVDKEIFKSALVFEDHAVFEEHLKNRSKNIKAAIADIFGRLPSAPPEVKELQERLAALLAAEKAHIVERQRITGERDQLSERLENASYRYLIAEKKLDRAKSAAVQKLERQAIMGGNSEPPSASEGKKPAAIKSEQSEVNGEVDHAANAAAETARREAMAASEKRKVQLEQLEAENKRLNDDLTSARTRMAVLSDDDYAKTDLFKLLKSQYEDVIKRINDLEAKNVQLREEAQKLQAERTLYRNQVDEESRTANTEMEVQLARAETDLARIRSLRDELASEVAIRKAAQDQQKLSTDQAKELATARDDRISALESEVERLRLELGQTDATGPALDDMSVDDLKTKLRTLEKQYSLLSNELPSMEAAWRKTQTLAAKKVSEAANWEEQISRISAEKAKADQKYFAAMKSKEAREIELRALKTQNAKSSEIVSQLKDAESNTRALAINLEKQLSEAKENLTSLSHQNRALQQKVSEGNIVSEGLKSQVAELKKLTTAKDAEALAAASAKRQVEVELEELRVRLEDTRRSLDKLKKQGSSASSADSDDWRVSYRHRRRSHKQYIDVSTESRHLSGLQLEPAQHRPQALQPRLLQRVCAESHLEPLAKVPFMRKSLRRKRLHAHHPDLSWNYRLRRQTATT